MKSKITLIRGFCGFFFLGGFDWLCCVLHDPCVVQIMQYREIKAVYGIDAKFLNGSLIATKTALFFFFVIPVDKMDKTTVRASFIELVQWS